MQGLLARSDLAHHDVLDGISTHFAGGSSVELGELLDEASRNLFDVAEGSLDERTAALSALLVETLGCTERRTTSAACRARRLGRAARQRRALAGARTDPGDGPGPVSGCADNLRNAMLARSELARDCPGHRCLGRCSRS